MSNLDDLAATLTALNIESEIVRDDYQEMETGAPVEYVYLNIYADGDEDSLVAVDTDARIWTGNGLWLTDSVMRVLTEIRRWQQSGARPEPVGAETKQALNMVVSHAWTVVDVMRCRDGLTAEDKRMFGLLRDALTENGRLEAAALTGGAE
jgi:hypothetical protein